MFRFYNVRSVSRVAWLLIAAALLWGCSSAASTPTPPAAEPSTAPTSAATSTPITLQIAPVEATQESGDLDAENQRMIDTAFANLTEKGSFAFNLNLTLVIDNPTSHTELVLRGDGALSGFDSADSNVSLETNITGNAITGGEEISFTVHVRFVDGVSYFQVDATRGVTSSQTPWTYATAQDMYESTFADSMLGVALTPEASTDLELPPLDDFLGLINLNGYITARRQANAAGGVAHFVRDVDLIGYVVSGDLIDLVKLIEAISPGAAGGMSDAELRDSFAQLGELLPVLFPQSSIRFHQYVNPDLTMNRLTFDVDFSVDEGVLSGLPPNDDPDVLTTIQADLLISFSRHGDSFDISAPEDAIPLADLQVEPLPTSEP